jgi:hypothetical protein
MQVQISESSIFNALTLLLCSVTAIHAAPRVQRHGVPLRASASNLVSSLNIFPKFSPENG